MKAPLALLLALLLSGCATDVTRFDTVIQNERPDDVTLELQLEETMFDVGEGYTRSEPKRWFNRTYELDGQSTWTETWRVRPGGYNATATAGTLTVNERLVFCATDSFQIRINATAIVLDDSRRGDGFTGC